MSNLTRRDVIALVGAALLASHGSSADSAPQPRTRFDADTADGKRMLEKYARAVARMRSGEIKESDPRSWTYQWYIHAIPLRLNNQPVDKESELKRVFGPANSAARQLANEVWSTCQGHRAGNDSDMFLPWHRMYLLIFEQVVRSILNDSDFTLPYWDYTTPGKRSLPEAFRRKNDSLYGGLYRTNRVRNSAIDINAGDPLDKDATESPYTLAVMKSPQYQGIDGFCLQLDQGVHGSVHVDVGDVTNMGRVPTAAGDPIFWLHHCDVDRIWAGWNAMNGKNPTKSVRFAFADPAGQRVVMDSAQVGDTTALGYRYDTLPSVEAAPLTVSTAGVTPKVIASSKADSVPLIATPTRIPLAPEALSGPITTAVAGTSDPQRLFVEISGIRSNVEPGTRYEVFLDLPAGADAATRSRHFLGSFNFFKAVDTGATTEYSFDATKLMRMLRAESRLAAETSVTIIPLRTPAADSQPLVGKVTLIRR